jgi:hypothetical protein
MAGTTQFGPESPRLHGRRAADVSFVPPTDRLDANGDGWGRADTMPVTPRRPLHTTTPSGHQPRVRQPPRSLPAPVLRMC